MIGLLFTPDPSLDDLLRAAINGEKGVSAAIARVMPGGEIRTGSLDGARPIYPASVVKMFHLVYVQDRIAAGKVKETEELKRAMTDMIVESSNDATGNVVDTHSGATGGPALFGPELKTWMAKRAKIDDYFRARGYADMVVRQKTWNEGPYGRDRQGYGPNFELRNMIAPDHCVKLLAEVAAGKLVPRKRDAILGYLERKVGANGERDAQGRTFLGGGLPENWTLYSKAGWVNQYRHDAVLVRTPRDTWWAVSVFTEGRPNEKELLPNLGRKIFAEIDAMDSGR